MSNNKNDNPLLGRALYRLFWLLGMLPSWWHYLWSDILAFITHHLIGYRKEIVKQNLQRCFPEKSSKELLRLEHQVYVNLCDVIVEIIMLCAFSKRRLAKHLELINGEIFGKLHDEGHPNIYMLLGHYGNWEWYTALQEFLPETEFNILYHDQHGVWNYLMNRIRGKFGAKLLEKHIAPKTIIERRHEKKPRSYVFVADQCPWVNNINVFVKFFGQITPTYSGMERLAKLSACPVVYIDVFKPKRGKYQVVVELMTKDASEYKEGRLAFELMQRLEKTIRRAPQHWLWTHNRWHYSVEDVRKHCPERKIIIIEE